MMKRLPRSQLHFKGYILSITDGKLRLSSTKRPDEQGLKFEKKITETLVENKIKRLKNNFSNCIFWKAIVYLSS